MIQDLINEIERKYGVLFDDEKLSIELEMHNLDAAEVLSSPRLFEEFVEDILIKETYFFREKGHFEVLRDRIFNEIVEKRGKIRIWSAGCATGEEPYSISIFLKRKCANNCEILGSDASKKAIERAKKAVYTKSSLRALSEKEINLYFEKLEGSLFRLRNLYRNVTFFTHNLLEPLPLKWGKMDVVFVRNTIMYFSERAKKLAISNIKSVLREDGYIFLGVSEYLIGVENGLYPVEINGVTAFTTRPAKKPESDLIEVYTKSDHRKLLTKSEKLMQSRNVEGFIMKALGYMKAGKVRSAIETLEMAKELDEKIYFIHYQLAQLYEEVGDHAGFSRERAKIRELLEAGVPVSQIDRKFRLNYTILKNFSSGLNDGMTWVLS